MPCDRKGKVDSRSGVSLAVRDEYKWFIYLWAQGLGKHLLLGMVLITFFMLTRDMMVLTWLRC